jgi:hypothetical protein
MNGCQFWHIRYYIFRHSPLTIAFYLLQKVFLRCMQLRFVPFTYFDVCVVCSYTLCSKIFCNTHRYTKYILYRTTLSYFRHGNRKVKIYMSCDMPFGFKMHPLSILVHTVCTYILHRQEKINIGNECIRLLIHCLCLVHMQYYFYDSILIQRTVSRLQSIVPRPTCYNSSRPVSGKEYFLKVLTYNL